LKTWKNCDVKSLAKRFAAVARSQRHIDDVVVFAALRPVCTENLIRVDEVKESPKLTE
jgi:hypothetical protein